MTLPSCSGILSDSRTFLARLGGDEFAILVTDAAENDLEAVRQRIELKLRSFNADPGRRYDLSFSVGIVSSDATQHSDIEHLLSQADALMYRQKPSKKDSRGFLTASP